MACTDVARTKAKATAINLIIVFLLFDPQEEIFLKNAINSAVVVSVQHDRSVRQRAFAASLTRSPLPLPFLWKHGGRRARYTLDTEVPASPTLVVVSYYQPKYSPKSSVRVMPGFRRPWP